MAKNQVIKTYSYNDTWIAPQGVSSVTIRSVRSPVSLNAGSSGITSHIIDSYLSSYATGANGVGYLGVGDIDDRSSPVLVVGGLSFVKIMSTEIGVGASSYGLTSTGQLYSWGTNNYGQLGLGTVIYKNSPTAVLGGLTFSQVSVNGYYCLGLTTSGKLYSWGINDNGQLGLGDTNSRSSPVLVLGGLTFTNAKMGSFIGSTNSYGLTDSGSLYAWGANSYGQLGHGDLNSKSSPVLVLGGLNFIKFSSSYFFSLGLTSSGKIYSWGLNGYGELGLGDTNNRSSPVAVLSNLTFKDISVLGMSTNEGSFGLTSSGQIYSWGRNANGMLGLGDNLNRSSPVLVLGGLTFKKMFGSGYSYFGLTTSGQLYSWGLNSDGQLGVGDVVPRSSPTLVLGGLTFSQGSASKWHTLGAATSGKVYSWGRNSNGQLGLSDITGRSSPTLVGYPILNMKDSLTSKTVSVTPGTSYDIKIQQHYSSFGAEVLDYSVDSLTLEYYT